jgi:uncharacterized protein YjbI with pentapeptide repeats/energy-coupling factor transporter ATP-binding protein EcfA2
MLEPALAPVRPHVISPVTGDSVPLEDEVLDYLQRRQSGLIVLLGEADSGKTTALAHLAAVLPASERLQLLDDPPQGSPPDVPRGGLTICGLRQSPPWPVLATLRLQLWGRDEWIEYLLRTHKADCGSVLDRIGDGGFLEGSPRWWRIVLDALARNPSLPDLRSAVESHLRTILPSQDLRQQAAGCCLASMVAPHQIRMEASLFELYFEGLPREHGPALLHRPIRVLLASEAVTRELQSGRQPKVLHQRLPREVAQTVGRSIADDSLLLAGLKRLVGRRNAGNTHAMAASLLRFADPHWRPDSLTKGVNLQGAYLDGVVWSGVSLRKATLVGADFMGADLDDADLDQAWILQAGFLLASLRRASLVHAYGEGAVFTDADLTRAVLNGAELNGADFVDATLARARMVGTSLVAADFTRAKLQEANFANADLHIARLDEADLTDAELVGASLINVDLRTAILQRTNLRGARLIGANLEEVDWPAARLTEADLSGAHLTGSRLPHADLRKANLSRALLGEVDWEQADLREADLREANFHMGSTREGLLSSPLASEGTRTGFYTDEYLEQHFKPPEEIRKANLRGCDLRGANIEGVDFYLVDLREALLDAHQLAYLQKCGAILSGAE